MRMYLTVYVCRILLLVQTEICTFEKLCTCTNCVHLKKTVVAFVNLLVCISKTCGNLMDLRILLD